MKQSELIYLGAMLLLSRPSSDYETALDLTDGREHIKAIDIAENVMALVLEKNLDEEGEIELLDGLIK